MRAGGGPPKRFNLGGLISTPITRRTWDFSNPAEMKQSHVGSIPITRSIPTYRDWNVGEGTGTQVLVLPNDKHYLSVDRPMCPSFPSDITRSVTRGRLFKNACDCQLDERACRGAYLGHFWNIYKR